jgi:hypothetical protein
MELAKKLIDLYDKAISVPESRFSTDKKFLILFLGRDTLLCHLKWMLGIMASEEAEVWNPTKAHRWIGFIQGVLWASGQYTIDELREHVNMFKDAG